jgi:hypothetical protein
LKTKATVSKATNERSIIQFSILDYIVFRNPFNFPSC